MQAALEALSGVPLYGLCFAAVAFLVTITGVIIYLVIQNRLEKEEEDTQKAGKGMAPVQHPEPIHAWIKMACAPLDNGTSWAEEPVQKAQNMLRNDWSIMGGPLLENCLGQLMNSPCSAWNDVRLLRVALAGYRAGYIDLTKMWNGVRPIVQRLQQQYPSFEAIWLDYQAGYRAWRHLPADGSMDDQNAQQRMQAIQAWKARPPLVDFRVNV
jgi:hypothetical protein